MLALAVLLVGCATAGGPSETASSSASTPDNGTSDLMAPENCSTALFYEPNGNVLDLTGRWFTITVGDPQPTPPSLADWSGALIRQKGDCLWGVDEYYEGSGHDTRRDAILWYGRLGNDFQINGVYVYLLHGPEDPADFYFSDLALSVGFGQYGGAFLCDRHHPECPEAIGEGSQIQVRPTD